MGTKYSEAFNACFLDEVGQKHFAIMGCYGIGVTRTLQAVIEQCNDKDGIIWPLSVAPYTVCLTPLSVAPDSAAVMKLAAGETLRRFKRARGVEVILTTAMSVPVSSSRIPELIGFPTGVGIGEKSLTKGEVELKSAVA